MEVYVILESFTDYGGGNATSWGVFINPEMAVKAMPSVIAERFGFDSVEEFEEEYGVKFNDYYCSKNHQHWCWDRGDDITEFYIQKDKLIEPELPIKEQILKLGLDNISKSEDAGYGMYNYYVSIPEFRGQDYSGGVILQMYPIKDSEFYGTIYLLAYYPTDDKGKNYDHDDIAFEDMSEDEQKMILDCFKKFCE